ncbi:hypothetical protein ID866_4101 [Astraeus odoratus]|nr:hypothetical protein ID866_4101 [Astraeus odoratus]
MTVRTITISSLKQLKNAVIGNPSAKLSLARDTAFVHSLVSCLNYPAPTVVGEPQGSQDDIRIEAVHVISSLAYGSETTLSSLLRANTHQEIVRALANPFTVDSPLLKAALARGLRVLASAIADVVGPSYGPVRTWVQWVEMLDTTRSAHTPYHLTFALETAHEDSSQAALAITQLIGAAVRNGTHRSAVIEWLPPNERQREIKSRRGWEKHDAVHAAATGRHGAWVLRHLIAMIQSKNLKVQEAAFYTFQLINAAAVPALQLVLSYTKNRMTNVQLAASSCITHIIRAQAVDHPGSVDQMAALTVIHVVNRILESQSEQTQNQIKACYTIYSLVRDEKDLSIKTAERGVLASLASLVKSITPLDNASDWEIDEPEYTVLLREAALKAIAAISLFDKPIKREVADTHGLIPVIQACLTQKSVGVRCSACHCLRSLSRDAAVIRTNITDSGAGMAIYGIFKKEDEDVRVTAIALSTVCNLVNEFSPLRRVMLEDGLLPRLMQLLSMDNQEIRVGVLWAIKNLLVKSILATKEMTMSHLGWSRLEGLTNDPDPDVQEQAFAILRNLTEDEAGLDLVFSSMGEEVLSGCLAAGLDSPQELATHVLGHIANGSHSQQNLIFTHPHILDGMYRCLEDARPGTRVPLVACLLTLLGTDPGRKRDFADAGFLTTLRHLCERTGSVQKNGTRRALIPQTFLKGE